MMKYTKPTLTIFEGPDGGGKSSTAMCFAKQTNAHYVHFGSLNGVQDITQIYIDAMAPVLHGESSVVFDRSWISEVPYGRVFRGGANRISSIDELALIDFATICNAVVVMCLPSRDVCVRNYNSRREVEMLEHEQQLKDVYDIYSNMNSSTLGIPMLKFNFEIDMLANLSGKINSIRPLVRA